MENAMGNEVSDSLELIEQDMRECATGKSPIYFADRIRALRQGGGVSGELVEMGDDEEGQPRIVIHTTRDALRGCGLILFRTVTVSLTPGPGNKGRTDMNTLDTIIAHMLGYANITAQTDARVIMHWANQLEALRPAPEAAPVDGMVRDAVLAKLREVLGVDGSVYREVSALLAAPTREAAIDSSHIDSKSIGAPIAQGEQRDAEQELLNIANAKRFDRECFSGDTEFADWAQSRCRYTLASRQPASPAEPVTVPVVTGTAPERIWLQVNADARPSEWDLDQPFPSDHDGITWADEAIGGVEVEYVRVDLPSLWTYALTAAKAAPNDAVAGLARSASAWPDGLVVFGDHLLIREIEVPPGFAIDGVALKLGRLRLVEKAAQPESVQGDTHG
jgi:hypothetical protein